MNDNLKITLNVSLLIIYAVLALSIILRLILHFYDETAPYALILLPLFIVAIIGVIVAGLFGFSYLTFRLKRTTLSRYRSAKLLRRLNYRLASVNGLLTLFLLPIFLVTFSL